MYKLIVRTDALSCCQYAKFKIVKAFSDFSVIIECYDLDDIEQQAYHFAIEVEVSGHFYCLRSCNFEVEKISVVNYDYGNFMQDNILLIVTNLNLDIEISKAITNTMIAHKSNEIYWVICNFLSN